MSHPTREMSGLSLSNNDSEDSAESGSAGRSHPAGQQSASARRDSERRRASAAVKETGGTPASGQTTQQREGGSIGAARPVSRQSASTGRGSGQRRLSTATDASAAHSNRSHSQQTRRRMENEAKLRSAEFRQTAHTRPIKPATQQVPVHSRNSIPYSTGNLSENDRAIVDEAFRTPTSLFVDSIQQSVKRTEHQKQTTSIFRLNNVERFRITTPPSRQSPPDIECSCLTWRTKRICEHCYVSCAISDLAWPLSDLFIQWLYDGCNNVFQGLSQESDPQTLDPAEVKSQLGHNFRTFIEERVRNDRFSLPNELNQPNAFPSEVDKFNILDIVSYMDPSILPNEVPGESSLPSDTPFWRTVVEGDPISNRMTVLAQDYVLYSRLCDYITPLQRVNKIMQKLMLQIEAKLDPFDKICEALKSSEQRRGEIERDAVSIVAEQFRLVMSQILQYLETRTHYGRQYTGPALNTAIELLKIAHVRDQDIYSSLPGHHKTTLAPSASEDCNLFLNLMTKTTTQPSERHNENDNFAINFIRFISVGSVQALLHGEALSQLRQVEKALSTKHGNGDARLRSTSSPVRQFLESLTRALATPPPPAPPPGSARPRRLSNPPEPSARRRRV